MEEILDKKYKKKYGDINQNSACQQLAQPKILTKSRIKAMQGRIFWTRNNSQSSLENWLCKKRQKSIDKLKQLKQSNLRHKNDLQYLVNKLSLPKLKQSHSLHNSLEIAYLNKKRKNRDSQIICQKTQKYAYVDKKEKKKTDIQKLLQRFNKRCEYEIQNFMLSPMKDGKKSRVKQGSQNQCQSSDLDISNNKIKQVQDNFLPKKILSYITRYVR